jgi:UDP-2-acetamido-3-amino-2,3-dideoxy-glucuronate N-acetyltransferase
LNACQASLEQEKKINLKGNHDEKKSYFCHETAVIDDAVEIGAETKIWHFSHIMPQAKIGSRCNIGQNVVVGANVTIGDGCKIQNNVSVYEGVILVENVFCGPSMVFTNVMNPRCEIPRKSEFRPTLVRKGATLGANCTIVSGVTIGEYAFIGAGAVVTDDVPDFALMVGNPARQSGWMSRYGNRMDLPIEGVGMFECPRTGDQYQINNNIVTMEQK